MRGAFRTFRKRGVHACWVTSETECLLFPISLSRNIYEIIKIVGCVRKRAKRQWHGGHVGGIGGGYGEIYHQIPPTWRPSLCFSFFDDATCKWIIANRKTRSVKVCIIVDMTMAAHGWRTRSKQELPPVVLGHSAVVLQCVLLLAAEGR